MSACTVLMLVGLVLVVPLPRPTLNAATTVLRRALSGFAAPRGGGVVVGLHAGVDTPAPTLLRPVLFACWWTALALGAIQSFSGHP